mgnify:CR=1 FL=1
MSARRHLCLGLVLFVAAGGCHGPAPVAPAGAVAVAPAPPAPPPPSSPRPRAAPPPRPEPAAAPPARRESAVQRRKLPGGAQLIVESDPLASTVAIATFVTAVAAAETEPGSRHLLERLLLDRESPSGLLAARLRARGSEVVSFTAPDYTLYQVVTPRVLWKGALDLTTSLLAEPPLGAAALASQRQAVQSELAQAPGDGEALRRLLAARARAPLAIDEKVVLVVVATSERENRNARRARPPRRCYRARRRATRRAPARWSCLPKWAAPVRRTETRASRQRRQSGAARFEFTCASRNRRGMFESSM